MLADTRVSLARLTMGASPPNPRPSRFAVVVGLALVAVGCDAGGLLVVDRHNLPADPVVQGPSVTEMTNGGNLATNSKYRLFYSLGQPTQNQGVGKSGDHRLNGGVVGAAHGD